MANKKLKRQVRRRSTNKPYQERPMNMTEARKEIANALKYHRATRKLANEYQQLQLHHQHEPSSFQPSFYSSFRPNGRFNIRRRPKMYPPYSNKILHYLNDFSFLSPFPPSPTFPFPRPFLPPPPVSNFYPNTITYPFAQPPPKPEAPNFSLPSKILGFNLNLHHFNSSEPTLFLNDNTLDPTLLPNNNALDSTILLDKNTLDHTLLHDNILDCTHMLNNNMLDHTDVFNNNILDPTPLLNNNILEPTLLSDNNNSLYSYSSPTLSFSPFVTSQDVPSVGTSQSQGKGVSTVMNTTQSNNTTQASGSMHVAMDEEGMEEMKALGEQHQMELDDNMSMVTLVWWFDCIQKMEQNALEVNNEDETFHGIFDEELEFSLLEN